jgi:thiamine-phosphate pyrophosphorylase
MDADDQARAVDPEQVDYIAYGPFAATATKADAGPPIGAAGLAAVRALTALP